jgi:hypothetical protein
VYGRFVSRISRETTHASAELTKFGEGKLGSFFAKFYQDLIFYYGQKK